MSSPTTRAFDTPGGQVPPEIADFVSAVRGELDDLSPDEVTELTGGLEADLTDALAEAGSAPAELYGDPGEYARELRAAAGLPPRGAGGVQRAAGPGFAESVEQGFVVPARERYEKALHRLDAQPWWPGVRDFLVVLRPAWWVLRAWIVVESLFMMLNVGDSAVRGGFGGLVILLAAMVASVQAGRHTPLPVTWHRVTVAAFNLIAVLLLLPMMFASFGDSSPDYYGGEYEPSAGLNTGGEQVVNVFPYDAEGRPLTGVQLYDQNGRPLETSEESRTIYDESDGSEIRLVPGSPPGMAPRWNAFPLQQDSLDPITGAEGAVKPAPRPLSGVPLPASQTPTPGPTSSLTPTESPTASVTKPSKTEKAPRATPTATR
jgi:hypothetical protein